MYNSPPTPNFSRYPLLWLSTYFSIGIFVARCYDNAVVLAFAILVVAILSISKEAAASALIPTAFVALGVVCSVFDIASIGPDRVRRLIDNGVITSGEPSEIEGAIVGGPEQAYDGTFFTIAVERLTFKGEARRASGNVRVFAALSDEISSQEFDTLDLQPGMRIGLYCRLEREEKFRNPGGASRIEQLDHQGIDATATIKSPLLIEVLDTHVRWSPLRSIHRQRQWLIEKFRLHFSPSTAGVMIASLLGDKHFLDANTADTFREGGTFHVLVISGLHITFIGALSIWLVSFVTRRTRWQFFICSSFLWSYTLAVGADVPVVRASLMFTVLLLSRVLSRQNSLLNAFGLSVLVILVWRPGDLFSPSFQLTVVSVGAIVGCGFPLIEKLRAIGRWMPTAQEPIPPRVSVALKNFCELLYWNEAAWQIESGRQVWSANLFKSKRATRIRRRNLQSVMAYIVEGLLISIIVQIWMLPLLVVYFHRVSPVSIVLNLWVGFFLAIESFAAVVGALAASLSYDVAAPFIAIAELMNRLMMWLPELLSQSGVASFRPALYSGYAKCLYFAYALWVVAAAIALFKWEPFSLGASAPKWRFGFCLACIFVAIFGTTILLHPYWAHSPNGKLTIDFLDVGQGDSALITFPDGTTMLVDGGGRPAYSNGEDDTFAPDTPRIGEAVVSEFLWEKGYSKIDYVVATHADADHMQGLIDVTDNFEIGTVIVGRVDTGDAEFDELIRISGRNSVPVLSIHSGEEMKIGSVDVQVLDPTYVINGSANNSSIVLKLVFGQRSFLLTGDIEKEKERELIELYSSNLRADLVKVAHHGSRTSSTSDFIRTVNAGVAVISVGRKSPFGHPHPEVIARWRDSGAVVLTTGESGTITAWTDGHDLELQTFVP